MFKKKIVVLMALMCTGIALVSCTEKKESTITGEVTETTTQKINNNPLAIEGYEHYGEDNLVNKKDVALVGKIVSGAKIDDLSISNINVYKCNKDEVVVEYSVSDYLEILNTHIAKLDAATYNLENEMLIGEDYSVYTTRVVNGTLCMEDDETGKKITKYNDDLEKEYAIDENYGNGMSSGIMSSDGNKIYYACDGWLKVYDTIKKESSVIDHEYNMYVDFIRGVIKDESGNDYILMNAIMGDCKSYGCIINANTKEMEYLKSEEEGFSSVDNDIFTTQIYDEEKGVNESIVTGKNGNIFTYIPKNAGGTHSLKVLNDGNLCFESFRDGKLNISIYDANTGELIAKTSFEVPLKETTEAEGNLDYAYLLQTPIYMDENRMLFTVCDNMFNYLFYIWDMSKADEESEYDVTQYDASGDLITTYEDTTQVNLLRKGECSDEFKPLLKKVNVMEEKYGVDIFIAEESGKVMAEYAIFPLMSYYGIEMSLEYLDKELARYPEGFFEQFVYPEHRGMDIYISGSITTMDAEADVLETAGGLHNTDSENNVVIAMDCEADPSIIKQTFHHEMSHAIDQRVEYYYSDFAEKWNELNPGDIYMYRYTDYASEVYDLGLDNYVYDYLYMEDRGDESYFLDNYSLTYPTEDRARIFENIMHTDTWYPDYNEMPFIKDKMNFYAQAIRETFDTTGWENVEWERYLIDK